LYKYAPEEFKIRLVQILNFINTKKKLFQVNEEMPLKSQNL